MKSILKTKGKKHVEIVYPILMTYTSFPGSVVLFTDLTTGTVLTKFSIYDVGYYLRGWEPANSGRWLPLDSGDSVTLSND